MPSVLFTCLAVLALLSGCASMTKTTGAAPPPPSPAPARPPAQVAPPVTAVVDSGPTPEALAVLADIPDPVDSSAGASAASPVAPGSEGVPVPSPTQPLGDVAAAAAPIIVMTPESTAPSSAAPDTCWRVQVAATSDAAKAKSFAEAAGELLMQPADVEREGKLLKVRLKGCQTKSAAEALRARAVDAGFAGAFLFVGKRAP